MLGGTLVAASYQAGGGPLTWLYRVWDTQPVRSAEVSSAPSCLLPQLAAIKGLIGEVRLGLRQINTEVVQVRGC